MPPTKQNSADIRAQLLETIKFQRDRLWKFKTQKDPHQRSWNDAIKVMGQLLVQLRVLTEKQIEWSKSLSYDERRDVVVAWYSTLTRVQQERMLAEMHAAFRERYADDERTLDT